ncbi:hypothetical protein F511_12786 [Dorcoceras hygrometricum]|uniref:DUF4220 domain-containing protein n=1 Tax=Dorcoceras hygrometricum TaxID=472368 RepID=A0A2Z7D9F5_9LAMI|nr:hypothetical protein F511_12786 [Dorcoceras hygrometricum]
MEIPIPKRLKKIWDLWELRSFLILSLSLQTILIVLSPLRKRTKNDWIFLTLWSAYLLADWAANFAVGIISNSQGDNRDCRNKNGNIDADLLAFWAPFLLVHLGGPDTISAFSLEDNELWLRHLASLLFQSVAAIYVFLQSLPTNRLWMPTIFIFIDGLIKYAERTLSLYRASFRRFKDSMLKPADPGPNYAKLMDEYRSMKEANLPTRIETIKEPERGTKSVDRVKEGELTDTEVVLHAYRFFETFKGLIVDLIFSLRERNQSRDFFLERNYKDAFKLIEVELNFIYESLFSKVVVVYSSLGYLCRLISFALVVTSLGLFYCVDKTNFRDPDVALSYTLLIGAIALDVMAFIKLITSDWLFVRVTKLPDVDLKEPKRYIDSGGESSNGYFGRFFHLLFRRWSESVLCDNLIFRSVNPRSKFKEKIVEFFNLTTFLDSRKYVKPKRFTEDLKKHIFCELHMKSKMADDLYTAKEISAAKGDWTLRVESCTEFLPYILEVDYDQSLLVWHIATELCYNDQADAPKTDDEKKHREFSKLLSDYMLYLLVMQPQMMSKVAGIGQIRFRDTCEEAKIFFAGEFEDWKKKEIVEKIQRKACAAIVDVNTEVKPVMIKGDRSKSVLFDGCILAKELKEWNTTSGRSKWFIMSKIWVEMMSYAAINCRASAHAQKLSKGGELITMVWFLMIHFGLGDQFQINEGHGRAKLIVGT